MFNQIVASVSVFNSQTSLLVNRQAKPAPCMLTGKLNGSPSSGQQQQQQQPAGLTTPPAAAAAALALLRQHRVVPDSSAPAGQAAPQQPQQAGGFQLQQGASLQQQQQQQAGLAEWAATDAGKGAGGFEAARRQGIPTALSAYTYDQQQQQQQQRVFLTAPSQPQLPMQLPTQHQVLVPHPTLPNCYTTLVLSHESTEPLGSSSDPQLTGLPQHMSSAGQLSSSQLSSGQLSSGPLPASGVHPSMLFPAGGAHEVDGGLGHAHRPRASHPGLPLSSLGTPPPQLDHLLGPQMGTHSVTQASAAEAAAPPGYYVLGDGPQQVLVQVSPEGALSVVGGAEQVQQVQQQQQLLQQVSLPEGELQQLEAQAQLQQLQEQVEKLEAQVRGRGQGGCENIQERHVRRSMGGKQASRYLPNACPLCWFLCRPPPVQNCTPLWSFCPSSPLPPLLTAPVLLQSCVLLLPPPSTAHCSRFYPAPHNRACPSSALRSAS